MGEQRLTAVLGPAHAAPDPARQRIGAGSRVVVVQIDWNDIDTWGRALVIDEWGVLSKLWTNDLIFEDRPLAS